MAQGQFRLPVTIIAAQPVGGGSQKRRSHKGFTQLAVELIALSQAEDREQIYGAVTIGNIWQFGILVRPQQQIIQDLTLYRVPDDLEVLMQTLVGIVEGANEK